MKSSTGSLIILLVVLLAAGVAGGRASASDGGPPGDTPTSVTLEYVRAAAVETQPGQIKVLWKTNSELNTAGFVVMRSTTLEGVYGPANIDLILAQGEGTGGATYAYVDAGLTGGLTYYYYIREVTDSGGTEDHTEFTRSARPWFGVYLPLILNQ
jgi:hypothetical protein